LPPKQIGGSGWVALRCCAGGYPLFCAGGYPVRRYSITHAGWTAASIPDAGWTAASIPVTHGPGWETGSA